MRRSSVVLIGVLALVLPATVVVAGTPPELVAAYDHLADTILAAKQTEAGMVRSILASTKAHAEAVLARARGKIAAGQDAREDVEQLAALVAEMGNEGDAAVAAIRKRLVDGGHHHNAEGESQGLYDEGFVIVTRSAKKVFLDTASTIGKMAGSADVASLDAAWKTVSEEYRKLGEMTGN